MWRKKQDTIPQASCFANIMRDKDNGLAARFPDFLNIAVKLLPRERIECGEWLVHEKHPRIRRKGASERNALLHSTGKLVNVRALKPAQADQFEIIFRDVVSIFFAQVRF